MSDKDTFFENNDTTGQGSGDTAAQAAHNNSQSDNELGPTFSSLVGEGKRYKSPEELAKGKQAADEFIEQLKREAAELREDLSKRPTMDQILDTIKREAKQEDGTPAKLDEDTLAKMIEAKLTEKETTTRMNSNKEQVQKELIKHFGEIPKAESYIAAKAQELGMTMGEIKQMSVRNPTAFFKLIGLETNKNEGNAGQPHGGSVNTEALRKVNGDTGSAKEGTFAYYQELRKANPKSYYSPAVQNQMMKDRQRLGEDAFYNRKS